MLKTLEGVTEIPTLYNQHKEIIKYLNLAIEDMDVIFQERDDKGIDVVPRILDGKKSSKNILTCLQNSESVTILIRSVKNYKKKAIVFKFDSIQDIKEKLLDVKVKTKNNEMKIVKKTVEQAIKDEYIRVLKGDKEQSESI
ncbi:hypothetical protein [Clostridium sp. M14]|uniref:hypothetical protein n=1 Tax=Clostridium sp. M14 TaxID=2716311 RepID=UPI0013EE4AB2|nr:hypothetical protein [Clostridium sp. M14]MBZ9693312.1 hypothetical protein [Clostridium sp. M14]